MKFNFRLKKRQQITEKSKCQEQWYKDARNMTVKKLPKFIKHLTNDYEHDYGTICHAVTAAAIGAAWAVDASPQGGITGFQAGVIMWEFMKQWNHVEFPAKLLRYENALYPQYEHIFTSMSPATWEWLQKEARKRIDDRENACAEVKSHWQSIANGIIPFGLKIDEEV